MKILSTLSTIDTFQDSNSVSFQWIFNKYKDFSFYYLCFVIILKARMNSLCTLKSLQRHLRLYVCAYDYNKYVYPYKQLK